MNIQDIPENPYLLLTPGPLSTSKSVRAAMLRDWCTWDDDYNLGVIQDIRSRLVRLAADVYKRQRLRRQQRICTCSG